MKYIPLFIILFSLNLSAQNVLKFDKRNVQCEDKWVTFQMRKDSTYTYGFIYIDAIAGLTFNFEGDFKIDKTGKFIKQISEPKRQVGFMKARLEPNRVAIAEIPESKFKELEIEKIPKWLSTYKEGENSIERLFRWGYMYNGWDECEKALTYLEKAEKINPNYKGLRVELAFSYNCLKRYSDAIQILKEAIKSDPKDAYTNKELIFSQVRLGQIDKAESSFRNALEKCDKKTYDSENAFQIVQGYFLKKDSNNFARVLSEFSNLLTSDKRFPPIVEKMKLEIKE